jgi:non-ribosomal peptide synthetase component E (peptide arylation enzyme)
MSVDLTETSYRQDACVEPLLGLTIGATLEDAAHRFPNNEALVSVHQGLRFSYAQLDAEVDACALGLVALGVGQGDRGSRCGRRTARSGRSSSTPPQRSARSWSR